MDYTKEQVMENIKLIGEGKKDLITLPVEILIKEEPKAYRNAYQRAYRKTDRFKAKRRASQTSEEYKEFRRAYQTTDKYRTYRRGYYQRFKERFTKVPKAEIEAIKNDEGEKL